MPHNFCFPSKIQANLQRRFRRVPFQSSQVAAISSVNADVTLSASSSSTKANHILSADNNLFSSGNDSDSVESKENGTPTTPAQVSTGVHVGGGGLFEDEEDDFFSDKSLKKSDSGKCVRRGTSVLQSKFR